MSIEMWTLATAIVTAVACALSGGLLLVKRDSMVSEGLSHAVLPGLAIGFLIFREYNSAWLIALATASGMLMVWLTSWLARTNLVDADAGLGHAAAGGPGRVHGHHLPPLALRGRGRKPGQEWRGGRRRKGLGVRGTRRGEAVVASHSIKNWAERTWAKLEGNLVRSQVLSQVIS